MKYNRYIVYVGIEDMSATKAEEYVKKIRETFEESKIFDSATDRVVYIGDRHGSTRVEFVPAAV